MKPSPPRPSSTSTTATNKKGTLYITVGPQCGGKTTELRRIFGASFHKNEEDNGGGGVDFTIDDQPLVYIPVPTSYFLHGSSTLDHEKCWPALNTTVYDKTILSRISDISNTELCLVTKRLGDKLSADEFASSLLGSQQASSNKDTLAQDLIDAVEHVLQESKGDKANDNMLPEKVDLFIVEAIFQPRPLNMVQKLKDCSQQHSNSNPSEVPSALDEAVHLLKSHATNQLEVDMSWGNTNTRPREYSNALLAASMSGRPVEFIVFGGKEACEMIRDHVSRREYGKSHDNEVNNNESADEEEKSLLCLHKVDRKELLIRNLNRFIQTGRYVPSSAISDALVRVESLIANAAAEANKYYKEGETRISINRAKYRLDYQLAKLAGYHLNADRTVKTFNNPNNNGNRKRGRGSNRYQQQPGRYNGGRGGRYSEGREHNYGGRSGRSNSRTGGWNHHRQDHPNNYSQGRGYSQNRQENPDSRSYDNRGRGSGYNQNSEDSYGNQGMGRGYSQNRGDANGRGWNNNY